MVGFEMQAIDHRAGDPSVSGEVVGHHRVANADTGDWLGRAVAHDDSRIGCEAAGTPTAFANATFTATQVKHVVRWSYNRRHQTVVAV